MEIENFVPELYYGITSKEKTNGEEIELNSKTTFKESEKDKANEFCNKYNAEKAIVSAADTKRKEVSPGKLYSLSKLEGVLGERFKMSINETLDTVQSLYESGYVTYPRTNSEYMTVAEKSKAEAIINKLSSAGFNVKFRDTKTVFDDSKVEAHSALTPTTKLPDINKLTEKEKNAYETIRNRFVAVFCAEPCIVDRTTIKIDVGEYETFTLEGDVMVQKGWTEFDKYEKKDKTLPALSIGDIVNINFKPVEKKTTPPKHYTTKTLNAYLINPFRDELKDADNDDEEYKAILNGVELGTEASRPPIINNAIQSKYIQFKNDTYYILPDGKFYVETLEKLQIDMSKNKSVELSMVLKDVYKGKKTIEDSIQITKNEIERILSHKNDITIDAMTSKTLGTCPSCGKNLIMQSWGLGCSGYKDGCKFSINGTVAGKKLTESQIKSLIEKGQTGIIKGFKSKSGKKFDAKLKLVKNTESGPEYKLQFAFDADETREANKISAKCPCCGNEIKDDKWSWKCEKCGFSLNYKIAGKTLTIRDLENIIFDGKTDKIKGFTSKAGKKFDAYLVLDKDAKKVNFSFED